MRRRTLLTLSGEQVVLPVALAVADTESSPSTANATVTFANDGTWSASDGQSGNWLSRPRSGAGSDYEILWETGTGTLTTGTAGSYQSLSSGYTFGRSRLTAGLAEAFGTLRIRRAGAGAESASCPVTLSAEVI